MITRDAKIRELTLRTLPDGTEACSVSITFDEAGFTTLRLSRQEHDELALALRSSSDRFARFVVAVRLAPPTITDLAASEAPTPMNTAGGTP